MKRILAALGACALTLAACGGHTRAGPRRHASLTPAARCSPADYAMTCALTAPAGRQLFGLSAPAPGARGIDFAWSRPPAGAFAANGWSFAAGYLSYDAGKNLPRAYVDALHAAHVATVTVWETSANRAAQGYGAGASDARAAYGQALALGNRDRTIFFAVDFDASGPQVAGYFSGVHAVLGARAGAYGGYTPLAWLCAHHLVGSKNWQTYGWSRGLWLPASCAPLEQYLNGSSFDYDRAIAPDYGQFPYATPRPAFDPHYRYYSAGPFPSRFGRLNERAIAQRYDRLRAMQSRARHPHRPELGRLRAELRFLAARVSFLARHRCCLGEFNLPPTWGLWHRGFRYQGLSRRADGARIR